MVLMPGCESVSGTLCNEEAKGLEGMNFLTLWNGFLVLCHFVLIDGPFAKTIDLVAKVG